MRRSALIGSDFERRRVLYAHLDRDLRSRTRFFAAAELINAVLASLFRWSPVEVLAGSIAFLNELGASLEAVNMRFANAVREGRLAGVSLDHSLVCLEQQEVQRRWRLWSTRSGEEWREVRQELNGLLNGHPPVSLLAPFLPCSRRLTAATAAVRRGLGVDLDFANGSHRVQIGCALIRQLRNDRI
jgi:hypothetical protein